MATTLIIIILAAVISVTITLLILRRAPKAQDTSLLMLQSQLDALKNQVADNAKEHYKVIGDAMQNLQNAVSMSLKNVTDGISTRLSEGKTSNDNTNTRLDNSAKYMVELEKRLAMLGEKTEALALIGRDVSKLSDIFQSPKLRGNLGELILEKLLEQIFPRENYSLQYKFQSDNTIVDAIIKIGGRIVPVDAKFPLENFKRIYSTDAGDEVKAKLRRDFLNDVKKHIDAISSKYIKPGEGTFEFALMYIPSETIYYEIITRDEKLAEGTSLLDYAKKLKVIPVSPNSFYAYLQVIVFGLKGMEIEKSARDIQDRLRRTQVDFKKFFDHFLKIGGKIDSLQKEYENAVKRFELLDRQVGRITGRESLLNCADSEVGAEEDQEAGL